MIPRCRAVWRSTVAAGLGLSLRRRQTRIRRLSLLKQKRDSSENTTLCHSVVQLALSRHHCKRRRLCCWVNGSLLNGRHECRPQVTNRRIMVLDDMGASRMSCTCCKRAAEVACEAANACRQMRRSTRAEVFLAAPEPFKRATFPWSNHLCHNRCTVDSFRWISAEIWRMDQLPF